MINGVLHIAPIMLIVHWITLDCLNSPADENPKGTSATAEGRKRASVSAAMAYGYCIIIELQTRYNQQTTLRLTEQIVKS